MTKPYESGYIDSTITVYVVFLQMDYSRMIKITDKARKEISAYIFNQSKGIRFEILNLVFKVYCRICKGKEDSEDRWHKPYYCKRYPKRIWCRVETFKECSCRVIKARDPEYE